MKSYRLYKESVVPDVAVGPVVGVILKLPVLTKAKISERER